MDTTLLHYDTLAEAIADLDEDSHARYTAPADGHPDITITMHPNTQVEAGMVDGVVSLRRGWSVVATVDGGPTCRIDCPDTWESGARQAVAAVVAARDAAHPSILDRVRSAAARAAEAQAEERAAVEARDTIIRDAIAAGARSTDVAAAAGVSRQIIHRITSR